MQIFIISANILVNISAIAPMITSARAAITNNSNEQALVEFSQKSDNVSNDHHY